MTAFNFQRQFAEAVRSGTKPHTIRARRKNGYLPTPGERIKLYTGMRTKQCELLREVTVVAVRSITINYSGSIILDNDAMTFRDAHKLAGADGFGSLRDFHDFFREKRGDSFNGYLIEWDPKS